MFRQYRLKTAFSCLWEAESGEEHGGLHVAGLMVIFYLKWYISFSDQLELLIWNGDKNEKNISGFDQYCKVWSKK